MAGFRSKEIKLLIRKMFLNLPIAEQNSSQDSVKPHHLAYDTNIMNFYTSVKIIKKQVNHDQTDLISKFNLRLIQQNLPSLIQLNGNKLYQTNSVKYLANINQLHAIQKSMLLQNQTILHFLSHIYPTF